MLFINVEFKMVGVFAHSNAFLVGKPVKVPLIKQSSFQLECNETQFNYSAMVFLDFFCCFRVTSIADHLNVGFALIHKEVRFVKNSMMRFNWFLMQLEV